MTVHSPHLGPAIQVSGLVKSYGDHVVLRGVELDVAPGSVLALLGSNGAGRTTIVRILATVLRPDGRTVRVAGARAGEDGAGRADRRVISRRRPTCTVQRARHSSASSA